MTQCNKNTIMMGMPSKDAQVIGCNSGTSGASGYSVGSCEITRPGQCCTSGQIGPRPQREKVREEIRDYILLMLGAPVLTIELDPQQIDLAIDMAFKIFEDYAPREYFQYYVFQTVPGQSVYEMPPDVGLVRQVYYKEQNQLGFQGTDLGGVIPMEYLTGGVSSFDGGVVNPIQPMFGSAGPWALFKQYEQLYSRMSSQLGGWEFLGGMRHIKLYPVPCRPTHVIVHYLQSCPNFSCMTQALAEGSLAISKQILGRIRSKIQNPPGPNGGIQLDGLSLLQEGNEEKLRWQEELITRYGDLLHITLD